ncbi:thioredoxin family protein [Paenibacillus senegalensis]|uniref:thioredoxin family protein n=1 Tax=Paenibacillus senegalensis TaxID=1465766 RepID=UPI0002899E27|nr:thioredoxin family protein [Paenibacillus senegalensis]
MKKLIIYVSIIAVLFAGLFFVNKASVSSKNAKAEELYGTKAENLRASTVKLLDDPNYQSIVSPEELAASVQAEESMFVYFFSPECEFCLAVTPVIYPMAQDMNIDLKQFNLLENQQHLSTYNITSWPVLAYFENGKEVERITGQDTDENYRSFFEKYSN